jgi:hypothetical protein
MHLRENVVSERGTDSLEFTSELPLLRMGCVCVCVCVCEKIAIIHLILSPIGLKMPCYSDLSCVILLAKFYARRKILAFTPRVLQGACSRSYCSHLVSHDSIFRLELYNIDGQD